MKLTATLILVLSALCARDICAGDPHNPHGANDFDAMIDSIPTGPLEEGVVLQAGDSKVMLAAVEKAENAYFAAEKKNNPKFVVTNEIKSYIRRRFAFKMLTNELALSYIKENKLELAPDVWEKNFALLKENRKQAGTTYEEWLAENGLNDAEFQRICRANWTIEDHIRRTVKQSEVDQLYEIDMDKIPLRRASHILFMYKGSERAPEKITRTKEEAKTAAEEMLKKLQAGEDFAEAAKKASDCPSAQRGGDLDYFPRRDFMAEPFAKATYELAKVGDLSGVVETNFGFHIIKLTDIQQTDSVKAMLRKKLVNDKYTKRMQQIISESVTTARFNEKML